MPFFLWLFTNNRHRPIKRNTVRYYEVFFCRMLIKSNYSLSPMIFHLLQNRQCMDYRNIIIRSVVGLHGVLFLSKSHVHSILRPVPAHYRKVVRRFGFSKSQTSENSDQVHTTHLFRFLILLIFFCIFVAKFFICSL